jgi:hypothetical protein
MESTNNKFANAANKQKTEQAKRFLREALASGGKLIGAQAEKMMTNASKMPKRGRVMPTT